MGQPLPSLSLNYELIDHAHNTTEVLHRHTHTHTHTHPQEERGEERGGREEKVGDWTRGEERRREEKKRKML